MVLGNYLGTAISGTLDRGNSSEGVTILNNAHDNVIGGTSAGAANVIAFNGSDGIAVSSGTNNALRANAVFSNAGLGIDLASDGVLANDAGDADTGANQLQNYPILSAASISAGLVLITGSLNSRPATTYELDFFANPLPDGFTNGEGQVYLGSTNVTTGADSNATFTVTFSVTLTGRYVSATATDPFGNTSEFSPCVRADSSIAPLTLAVVNTNDSGAGSLRQALLTVNSTPASSNPVVRFDIPGAGVRVISPAAGSPLPVIIEPVNIDGFTQPGSSANSLSNGNNAVWLIRLDGNSTGSGADGLRFLASSNMVRGLMITRFTSDGIELTNGRNNVIVGNCLGLDELATDQGNAADGVFVNNSMGNRIGGAAPADRNIISGNNNNGIELSGPSSSNNIIIGNYIGPDPGGTLDRRNSGNGIFVSGAPGTIIGGVAPGERNLISRNQGDGVELNGLTATNTLIVGNFIGTDVTGTTGLGNLGAGILITSSARFNTVGAINSEAGNVIAFNGSDGVNVLTGTNNAIRGNNIFSNTALGIDLSTDGVTPNDPGDADGGGNLGNDRQNFPHITTRS